MDILFIVEFPVKKITVFFQFKKQSSLSVKIKRAILLS